MLDAVERDAEVPTRLIGSLRAGGHRLRIVLDFGRRDLGAAEYVETPWLLEMHQPSQRAVVSTLFRIDAGEAVPLPYDLSDTVRGADPPSPWQPLDDESRERLAAAADQVDLKVLAIEKSRSQPSRVKARLELDGRPVEVDAEVYAEQGTVPLLRWMGGIDPADLTPAQRYAIQRALQEYG